MSISLFLICLSLLILLLTRESGHEGEMDDSVVAIVGFCLFAVLFVAGVFFAIFFEKLSSFD